MAKIRLPQINQTANNAVASDVMLKPILAGRELGKSMSGSKPPMTPTANKMGASMMDIIFFVRPKINNPPLAIMATFRCVLKFAKSCSLWMFVELKGCIQWRECCFYCFLSIKTDLMRKNAMMPTMIKTLITTNLLMGAMNCST